MAVLDATKAYVDVGHEMLSFAWRAMLRRHCQTLREQEDWATRILASKTDAPSKEECVDL